MYDLRYFSRKAELNSLLEQISVDKDTKLIPLTIMSNENVLYWKCIIKHLQHMSCTEELESIIPELSAFCNYISEFIALISSKEFEEWEKQRHKFILLQLFEISETYDLADEVGRKNLQEIIIDTMLSNHCSDKIIECIARHLTKVIPDPNAMMDAIANVISEIRLPSKESVTETPQETSTQQQQQEKLQVRKQFI